MRSIYFGTKHGLIEKICALGDFFLSIFFFSFFIRSRPREKEWLREKKKKTGIEYQKGLCRGAVYRILENIMLNGK